MGITETELEQMASALAASMGLRTKKAGHLHLATEDGQLVRSNRMSALQRDVLYSRIRDLGNMYWLKWLIRQETMHTFGVVEALSDEELTGLLAKMERAKECREDGVGFDEVPGLVRGSTIIE